MHAHRWLATAAAAAVMGLMTAPAIADPELTPTPAQQSHDAKSGTAQHDSAGTSVSKPAAAQSTKQSATTQKHSEQPPAPPKDKSQTHK